MTTLGLATSAFRTGRVTQDREAARRARSAKRTALLVTLFTWLGAHLPKPRVVRQTVLRLGAFAFLDYAAWRWDMIAGLVAIGLTLLLLEWMADRG